MAIACNPTFPGASQLLRDAAGPALQFLRLQPWFPQLSLTKQEEVAASVFTLGGGKGDVLLHVGEEVKGWYAVLSGLVKLQSQSAEGRRQGFLGIPGGEWFGEGSVMKKGPRQYEAVALRDSVLLCLPRAQFEELAATNLPFSRALNEQLNMRFGQAMGIIEAMRLRTPEQRVAAYLVPPLWNGPRRMALSQEELGILAGLSRQTVNAMLKELERRGLVSLQFGRVDIVDEEALARFARGP
jgi:CRP/FNR family cyclic AMP-dependent transcriptional regulator